MNKLVYSVVAMLALTGAVSQAKTVNASPKASIATEANKEAKPAKEKKHHKKAEANKPAGETKEEKPKQ